MLKIHTLKNKSGDIHLPISHIVYATHAHTQSNRIAAEAPPAALDTDASQC